MQRLDPDATYRHRPHETVTSSSSQPTSSLLRTPQQHNEAIRPNKGDQPRQRSTPKRMRPDEDTETQADQVATEIADLVDQ